MPNLRKMEYRGYHTLVNKDVGYAPYFTNLVLHRINKKKATNIVVTGEAGIGKSYLAMAVARIIEGKTASGRDRFKIEQVVFTYEDFMDLVLKLRTGKIIVFDEPSYSMGKRDWYKQLNKALVQTVESFRFKVHPLVLPIINKNLLDKTIREHLLQFQINVTDRGKADVYRLQPSQFVSRTYHHKVCSLEIPMLDHCDNDSCLDCPKLMQKNEDGKYVCNLFRAQYERKKANTQESRYEQAKEQAKDIETKQLTMKQLENLLWNIKEAFIDEDNREINVQYMRVAANDEYGINLSNNKAYRLKAQLEVHHPELR